MLALPLAAADPTGEQQRAVYGKAGSELRALRGTTPLASSPFRGFWASNTQLLVLQSLFQHPLVLTAAFTRYSNGDTISLQTKPPLPAELLSRLQNHWCAPLQELPTPPRVPAAYSARFSVTLIFPSANEMLIFLYHKENNVISLQMYSPNWSQLMSTLSLCWVYLGKISTQLFESVTSPLKWRHY